MSITNRYRTSDLASLSMALFMSFILMSSMSATMLCSAQKSNISCVSFIPPKLLPPTILLTEIRVDKIMSVYFTSFNLVSFLGFYLGRIYFASPLTREEIGSSRGLSGKPTVINFPFSFRRLSNGSRAWTADTVSIM